MAELKEVDSDYILPLDSDSWNSSDEIYEYDLEEALRTFHWDQLLPPLLVYVTTLILGVTGNSLIIYTVFSYRGMKSTTNIFLASLALADLLLLLVCVPVKIGKIFAYSWTFGWFWCKALHYLQNVSVICSVLNLTAMSLERYYAIMFPFRSKYILTVSQAHRITVLVWLSSLFLSTPVLWVQVHTRVGHKVEAYWCHRDWENWILWRAYEMYMLLVVLVIPTLAMGFAYSAIGYRLTNVIVERTSMVEANLEQAQESDLLNMNRRVRRRDDKDMRKIVSLLATVVILFLLCWTPLLVTNVLWAWSFLPEYDHHPFYKQLFNGVHLIAYFNSCINPVVYGFMSRNFRNSFSKALCPCLQKKREINGGAFTGGQYSMTQSHAASFIYKESLRLSSKSTYV